MNDRTERGAMIGNALHTIAETFADRLPDPERTAENVVAAIDDGPTAEEVLGECVVDEPGADLPEREDAAGFGHGLAPTAHPTPAMIVEHLIDTGVSAGTDAAHGVVAYAPRPDVLVDALAGTGWAVTPLVLGGVTVPAMYVVERVFALPPVPGPRACRTCGTVRGSGCASCRPDSVLGA